MARREIEYMLQAESVIKQYRQPESVITAVNRANIKIEKGEFVAIIGSSGSGKSTFLHICAGLDKANAGRILIDNEEITKMGPDELGRFRGEKMGFIYQRHNLVPQFTALENILLPTVMCNKADASYQESLRELVECLGLSERLHHLPSELSGGQCQRVAIARALALKPDILCFDEPTSALDPELTGEVLRVIKELADQHTTMIIVTHEMAFARDVANKVIFMDDGVIVEQGDPKEVFGNPKEERTKQFLSRFTQG